MSAPTAIGQPTPKTAPKKRKSPARPYSKLTAEALDECIEKHLKRLAKANAHLKLTTDTLMKYEREKLYRNDPEAAERSGSAPPLDTPQ